MLHLHSGLRYVVLILILLAIVKSIIGWVSKKEYSKGDDKIGLFLMITAHLQLLIGLFLYMTKGWLITARFYAKGILPRSAGYLEAATSASSSAMELPEEQF